MQLSSKDVRTEPTQLAGVAKIVLHHTAFDAVGDRLAIFDRVDRLHLDRGWSGGGYHFLICGSEIIPCRPMCYQGAHVASHNAFSVGIAVVGDLTKREPTKQEVEAVKECVSWLKSWFGDIPVLGHSDLAATLCPGPDLVRLVTGKEAEADAKSHELVSSWSKFLGKILGKR